ncbi:MAG: hypothetical protein WBY88_04615 [Desulfosarcina sp.]
MSLRMIARDLYRLQKAVARLEARVVAAPADECEPLRLELARKKNERDQIKRMLDGHLDR